MNRFYGFHGKFVYHVSHWVYYPDSWQQPSARVTSYRQAIRLMFIGE